MLRLAYADLRRYFLFFITLVLLISSTVALAMFVNLQERATRLASAAAADKFDIVIGASGSETQLVLSTVFLQPSGLGLVGGYILDEIRANPNTKWASPIGFGDFYRGNAVVGVSKEFVTDGGNETLQAGRNFEKINEAVAGAKTGLRLGDTFSPQHGRISETYAHNHDEIIYTVVGIKKMERTAYDSAILVPIEAVWNTHKNYHNDEINKSKFQESNSNNIDKTHDHHDNECHHDEADLQNIPSQPVPAIVVKPNSFAGAYLIRQIYRDTNRHLISVFPGEILVKLYGILGDVKIWLNAISIAFWLLTLAVVCATSFIYVSQKRFLIAALRAFGASVYKIMLFIWLELCFIVVIGVVMGALLGYIGTFMVSRYLSGELGFEPDIKFALEDLWFLISIMAISVITFLLPVVKIYKIQVVNFLRE